MHTFSVSVGVPTKSCDCYNYLWDIDGEHQKIKGWPFVSTGDIRRYYANRDAASLDQTNSMEERPTVIPAPALTLKTPLNIYGTTQFLTYKSFARNPLCINGIYNSSFPDSIIGTCILGSGFVT